MLRLVRWAISVSLVQGAALLVLARLVTGFRLEPGPDVAIIALFFTLAQLVSWPLLYIISARIHPLIFPILSLVLSGALVLILSEWLFRWNIANLHVENLQTGIIITLGLTFSYTLFGGLFSLRDLDAYDWFVTSRLRRTFTDINADTSPGTIFLEIDGLSAPLLQRAIDDGWMPSLAKWQKEGTHVLSEWETDLSSQTSASQAGILLGDNGGIPAFRWYDKPEGRLMVSSSLATTRDLERRLSSGKGLLQNGASRWNVFSGDAPDSLLTYSTLGMRERRGTTSYLGLFASPYGIGRTTALYLGDVFRERWQAFNQRRRNEQPRIRRGWRYALVRAATTTIMLEFAQFMLLADMYRGVTNVYCTIFAYDEVAHHSGIDREDAMKVLTRIDAVIGTLKKESQRAPRPYHLVILSDHGQSMGPTFRQRNGQSLGELVSTLVDPAARISVHDSLVEDQGHIQLTLKQALTEPNDARTVRVLQQALSSWPKNREEMLGLEPNGESTTSDVVVLASGNLGLISFPQYPERMTYEEIVERYPMLLPGLLNNEDVGFVMMHSSNEGPLVMGDGGIHYLDDRYAVGLDPLAGYGERADDHLRRTNGFENAPDILVMSALNPETGEVYAFEELVGSHGGLGGFQTRPFVFHPVELPFPEEPVVGAETLHHVLVRWLDHQQAVPAPQVDRLPETDPIPATAIPTDVSTGSHARDE